MKRLRVLAVLSVIMTSCFSESLTNPTRNSNGSNVRQAQTAITEETKEVTATASVQGATPLPISSATPTATLIMEAATATTGVPDIVESQGECQFSPEIVEGSQLVRGLILNGLAGAEQGQIILGSKGLDDPFLALPDNGLSGLVSPDGNWIAFFNFLEVIDEDTDTYSVEITVTDFLNQEEYKIQYENISLSRQSQWNWANNASIIIPLRTENGLYRWQEWEPFANEQRVLSIQLEDIGGNLPGIHKLPIFDPLLESVVYPCMQCTDAEYRIRELESGKVVGTIELESYSTAVTRSQPVWSPDGKNIAIGVGTSISEDNGKLMIFNRNGEKIHEIDLPNRNDVVGGGALSWSPNSQYLAFYRNDPAYTRNGQVPTLSIFDLTNGLIKDLCLTSTSWPIWAQDSNRIAVSSLREGAEDQVNEIFVISIASGKSIQINAPIFSAVIGWAGIESEE